MKERNNTNSGWVNKAGDRVKNRKWLGYSSNIARRILAAIEDAEGINQAVLAEKIGVTPQQISKVIKGQENLTLETIAKISEALGVELITFPDYKRSAQNNVIEVFDDYRLNEVPATLAASK